MADGEVADGPSPTAGSSDETTSGAHAAPRRSRWRIPLIVIAIVVGAALVTGAGVALGRLTAPGPDVVVAAGPVVEESPGVEQLPVGASQPAPQPSPTSTPTVAGRPGVSVTATAPSAWPVVMTADPDLPDTAGVASGYRLVNSGISAAQVAGVLGSVFGISGTPTADGGTWVVGSPGGQRLVVVNDPLVTWSYEDAAAQAQPAAGPPMAADKAIELATELLGSIGVDTTSVDWQVDRYAGLTSVTAWQLVGGARTRLAWKVGFDPSGAVAQASGFSAGLEEVPGYPVVGAATAVKRSSLPEWSAVGPRPISQADASGSSSSPSPSPSVSPDRPAMTVPVTEVTATSASLGLAQYWQPDGSILFLPAYVLSAADGSRWTVLAVAEPYVQFVDQPYPTSVPVAP